MKALSLKQAQSCENALHPRCRCRCGGRLHGAKRGGESVPDRQFFSGLPEDDPHYLQPKQEFQQLPLPIQIMVGGMLLWATAVIAQHFKELQS